MIRKIILSAGVLFCCIIAAADTGKYVSFSHLSVNEGLSHVTVNGLYIDENDHIWIATANGVNSYDGNRVNVFQSGENDSDGLRRNYVKKITGDRQGHIYLQGTKEIYELDLRTLQIKVIFKGRVHSLCWNGGLYFCSYNKVFKYNREKGKCGIRYILDIPDGFISCIKVTDDGSFWMGTNKHGTFIVKDGATRRLGTTSWIEEIYPAKDGTIWIASRAEGVFCIDRDWNIRNYTHIEGERNSLSSNFARTFCEDDLGQMWIGTFTGLDCLERRSGRFFHYNYDISRPDALSHDSIWALCKDTQGTIWVGTYFGGVNYFNPEYEVYSKYGTSKVEGKGLSSPIVGCISEDSNGNLWICTEGGGLDFFNRKTGEFKWFKKETGPNPTLPGNNIKSLYYDERKEILWMGIHLCGVVSLNLRTGRTTLSCQDEIMSNNVRAMLPYKDSLLIGTGSDLVMFNRSTCTYKRMFMNLKERPTSVTALISDNSGNVWIGTSDDGVFRYNPGTGRLKRYHSDGSEGCLSYDGVHNIFQDSRGNIWICTSGKGLFLYIPQYDRFENFSSTEDGLSSDRVYKIVESSVTGNLIILTDNGISIYNVDTHEFRSYSKENGFPFSATNEQSLLCASDGTIFSGSTEGLISFREESLDLNRKPYSIQFSRLLINGKEVVPGDKSGILKAAPVYSGDLNIGQDCSMLTVELTTTNHIAANKDELEYRLEGLSDIWTPLPYGQNAITFSGLRPGRYRLLVRTAKANGMCAPLELGMHILPPWYGTKVAWCLYCILLLLGIWWLIKFYNARVKLDESLKYEQKRAADIEDLNQSKLRFFTNISHEIRTPLTIIIAQVESLMRKQDFTPALYNKILSIYKNSISLRELVNELLEFRKQEQGEMKIKVAPHNIINFINEFQLLFEEYATSKGIRLVFEKEIERLEVWYDQNQIQKVLSNLLSNSLKHTEADGEITIRVYSKKGSAVIEVADTGCGIPSGELENIFKRFYQVNEGESGEKAGTGIGLSLAKGIVEMHGGTISVSSEVGVGTTFKVCLPLGYSHFRKDQMDTEINGTYGLPERKLPASDSSADEFEGIQEKGHKMVIAEDNEGVRRVLVELFSPFYKVFAAEDGGKALKIIQKEVPSIIVSDVLMPVMTGIELCKKVKGDISTCHIPVVLLTARVAVEQNLEGLLTGADDYIAKPFNSDILLSRCNNLVNSRILLQEKFSAQPAAVPKILATNEMDQEFIMKVTELIESNLDNPEFGIMSLAREMALSRTGIFTKIKAITGQTPNTFIMTMRLKKGALLLRNNPEMNVSEISDSIGFSSPHYFSKCFRDAYGISPQNYRKSSFASERDFQ